ncbi:unnamed protein product, partial [Prorocentrum cordatum]
EKAARARANAVLRPLTALTTGRCDQLRDAAWGSATDWARSREPPRRISERVLECHRGARDLKVHASDAELAFERLALRAEAGAHEALAASDDDEGAPPRGKAMPFVSGEASLSPAGAEPCDIKLVSPKGRYYFDRFHERMALPPSQVDEADIEATRSYTDRASASELRAWICGAPAEVAVFFVMKKTREDGVYALRPAWDTWRVNERFRCRSCAEKWPYMARGGVSTDEFVKELKRRRMKLPSVPSGCRYLCLVAMVTGFSWSPAICRGALGDVICDLSSFPRHGQLIHGLIPPSFAEVAFIYWVVKDDFASLALVRESDKTTVETVKEAARARLKEVGLDMRKDGVGDACPLSLGATITEQPCRLLASREKIQNVIGSIGAVMARGRASSQELSRIIGSWVWLAMRCRPAFCLLDARYKFVAKFEGDQTRRKLWESALHELHMLYHLAPLEAGMGAVETQATRSEVKAEVDRRWRLQQPRDIARDEEEELLLTGDDWEFSNRGIPNTSGESDAPPPRLMADVLAGYGGFGEEVRSECQCETLSVDNARNPRRDLMGPSFVELMCRAIMFGFFFMVHMVQRVREGSALARAAIPTCFACLAVGIGFSFENP